VVGKKIAAEDSKAILTKLHFSRNTAGRTRARPGSRFVPSCHAFTAGKKIAAGKQSFTSGSSDFSTRMEITFIQILFI
jgi:hypothetical protein